MEFYRTARYAINIAQTLLLYITCGIVPDSQRVYFSPMILIGQIGLNLPCHHQNRLYWCNRFNSVKNPMNKEITDHHIIYLITKDHSFWTKSLLGADCPSPSVGGSACSVACFGIKLCCANASYRLTDQLRGTDWLRLDFKGCGFGSSNWLLISKSVKACSSCCCFEVCN